MKRKLCILMTAMVLGLVACKGEGSNTGGQAVESTTPGDDIRPKEELVLNDPLLKNQTAIDDNNRVFYEIFTGSFSDSNGDGIGDLQGIINRLDYLNDGNPDSGKSLGIGGIWLTPIFESPSYHKYDVTNYYGIDRSFGKMEDLKELISECHKRDIKLILDLPLNHTSKTNEMFVKFKEAQASNDVYNPYYHYYSFYKDGQQAPANRKFNDLGINKTYYECNFDQSMPELNFDMDEVRQEAVKIAKYYLDLGIDGFRFDAAKYIYMHEEDANKEFWGWYMDELRKLKKDIYTVAEVWDTDMVTYNYFDAGLGCFNFSLGGVEGKIAQAAKGGNVTGYTKYVSDYITRINETSKNNIIYPFITNHDMDRSAGFLTLKSGDAFVASSLELLSPGSPFIYYGDEIGIKGSRGAANTDANRRLRMLWGDGDTVDNPAGATFSDNKQNNGTVQDHIADEKSLYTHYKKLIMLRNANPEIARGTYTSVDSQIRTMGGFISTYNGSKALVLHNTSKEAVEIDLATLTSDSFKTIRGFAGMNNASLNGTKLTIGGQTSVILK